jgi:diguanylate cyclase (GGDEF)-like protein
MEVKAYWRILKRRWWLLAFSLIIVVGATFILTSRQKPVYKSSATFVIRPRLAAGAGTEAERSDDFVRALDMVSRRVEINTTFAEVATSRLIKQRAVQALGLEADERQGLDVSSRVIGGTNVLEINVEGYDPEIIQAFANKVGDETVAYVSGLYDVFELEPLDEAGLPARPIRPNLMMNLLMGSVLGLALGASLVFLLRYLETAAVGSESFNIVDRETSAYTRSYLLHRLWGEISRARRTKQPVSLGLLRVDTGQEADGHQHSHIEAMQLAKTAIAPVLREEDVLARFDAATFAILLPDTAVVEAQTVMKNAVARVRSLPQVMGERGQPAPLRASIGLATYDNYNGEPDEFLEAAVKALGVSGTAFTTAEIAQSQGFGNYSAEPSSLEVAHAGNVKATMRWPRTMSRKANGAVDQMALEELDPLG